MGAYNDDVLFIHIPKTGGTAFKHYMAAHLPDVKWPRPDDPQSVEDSKLPIGHIPLRDIPEFTGRPLDSWSRIVGIIRNPYEQQVSQWWFWHRRYAEGDEHPHSVHAAMHPRIHTWLLEPECDFHIWYEHRFHPNNPLIRKPPSAVTSYADWGGYYWYWLSVDGALPDNLVILKQEDLQTTGPAALAPFMDGTPPPMPEKNVGGGMDWVQVFSAGGIDRGNISLAIITQKFRWCLENEYYPVVNLKPA